MSASPDNLRLGSGVAAAGARGATRARPAWLRALGRLDPPAKLTVEGRPYRRIECFKQDAFAATARYAPDDAGNHDHPVGYVVKFSRTAPAFGLPMGWLGGHLCAKERDLHRRLADVPGVPAATSAVRVTDADHPGQARVFRHALARVYVPGQTLRDTDPATLPHDFFTQAAALLSATHHRGVAVMDLNKAENLLVDAHGRPHLIDFQLSVRRGVGGDRRWWAGLPGSAWWLRVLQGCDRYYLAKHFARIQPDAFRKAHGDLDALRPPLTRWWKRIARPTQLARRRLLVALRVRSGAGTADTETPHAAASGLR